MRRSGGILLALASSGCLMAGNYHSARTLGNGNSAIGVNFSMTTYEWEEDNGTKQRLALPTLIPELTFHIGLGDSVDLGGRVAPSSLGAEADLKVRLLHEDKVHLAVVPAIAYQALLVVEGLTVRAPVIVTYDVHDVFSVTAALFWQSTHFSEVGDQEELAIFRGDLGATGASIGAEIRAATLLIRPAVELTGYVARFDDEEDFDEFATFGLVVHFAFAPGQQTVAPPPPPTMYRPQPSGGPTWSAPSPPRR